MPRIMDIFAEGLKKDENEINKTLLDSLQTEELIMRLYRLIIHALPDGDSHCYGAFARALRFLSDVGLFNAEEDIIGTRVVKGKYVSIDNLSFDEFANLVNKHLKFNKI